MMTEALWARIEEQRQLAALRERQNNPLSDPLVAQDLGGRGDKPRPPLFLLGINRRAP